MPYCNSCYQPVSSCVCDTCNPCAPVCTDADGCVIKLDTKCIIYHKSNADLTALNNLGITNGATLTLILETIDTKIAQLNVISTALPCLRTSHVVNTLQQFITSVDAEICLIKTSIGAIVAPSSGITPTDSSSIDFTVTGAGNNLLTGVVKISAIADNQISIAADGLAVPPQSLSVNYSTKEISISGGNTIQLGSLLNTPSGFLGTFTADPATVLNGQYFFNSTTNLLKMKLNNVLKTISTT